MRDINPNNWYVYRHTKLGTSEVFYIGIGCALGYKRAYSKSSRSDWWRSYVKKYGFDYEVLTNKLSMEEACELERILVAYYKRADCCGGTLINLTDGGEGSLGKKQSEKNKKEHSERMKGRYAGEKNPMYGVIRESPFKGRRHPDSAKIAMSGERPHTQGGKSHMAKKVIDIWSGIIYGSCKEAAESINMKPKTLSAQLLGKNRNKTNFIFLKDYLDRKIM